MEASKERGKRLSQGSTARWHRPVELDLPPLNQVPPSAAVEAALVALQEVGAARSQCRSQVGQTMLDIQEREVFTYLLAISVVLKSQEEQE